MVKTTNLQSCQGAADLKRKDTTEGKDNLMKTGNFLLTAFVLLGLMMLTTPATHAQTCDGTGTNFVDLDGDGFNDNAPDFDGDGIPNGLDADYVKHAQDGSGYQKGKNLDGETSTKIQNRTMTKSQKFNRVQTFNRSSFQTRLNALGGANGSGTGICDGSGGGLAGTGVRDGIGSHGSQKRGGK